MGDDAAAEKYSKMVSGFDKVVRAADDYETTPILSAPLGLEPVYADDPDCGAYIVRAKFPMQPLPRFLILPITMAIYRAPVDGSVTLFNAFRVSEEIEDSILALGPIRSVVKLGQFHGDADAYYLRNPKFNSPKYWGAVGATISRGLEIDYILNKENVTLIDDEAELYTLPELPFIESVVTLPIPNHGRLLIACDALMHVHSTEGLGFIGQMMMSFVGFFGEKDVPRPAPIWCKKSVQLLGKDKVTEWFQHIDSMGWDSVVCGHGEPVVNCDRAKVLDAVAKKLAAL